MCPLGVQCFYFYFFVTHDHARLSISAYSALVCEYKGLRDSETLS